MHRKIVLVSGAPGTGKTTLAIPLAAHLNFPLISKDDIKEAIWEALDPPSSDLPWSRRIGGAAMGVLWALAARSPCAVLEANFRPHSEYERSRLTALDAHIVEVYCHCSAEEAARRYAMRAGTRHRAHVLPTVSSDFIREFDEPMGLGPVIRVSTHEPVDVALIASQVRAAFDAHRPADPGTLTVR